MGSDYIQNIDILSNKIINLHKTIQNNRYIFRPTIEQKIQNVNQTSQAFHTANPQQGSYIALDIGVNLEDTVVGKIFQLKLGECTQVDCNLPTIPLKVDIIDLTEKNVHKILMLYSISMLWERIEEIFNLCQTGNQRPDFILLDGILHLASILVPRNRKIFSPNYLNTYDNLVSLMLIVKQQSKTLKIPIIGFIKKPIANNLSKDLNQQLNLSLSDSTYLNFVLTVGEYTDPTIDPKSKAQGNPPNPNSPISMSCLQIKNVRTSGKFALYNDYVTQMLTLHGYKRNDPQAWQVAAAYYQHKWLMFQTNESLEYPVWKIQVQSWLTNQQIDFILGAILNDSTDLYGLPLCLHIADLNSRLSREDAQDFINLVKSATLRSDPNAWILLKEHKTHHY